MFILILSQISNSWQSSSSLQTRKCVSETLFTPHCPWHAVFWGGRGPETSRALCPWYHPFVLLHKPSIWAPHLALVALVEFASYLSPTRPLFLKSPASPVIQLPSSCLGHSRGSLCNLSGPSCKIKPRQPLSVYAEHVSLPPKALGFCSSVFLWLVC